MRRIIPFVFVCYVISYIDRVNVGFAALTMNRDLGLTPAQFGLGAGLFFIGYFLFEIPSNLIMQRVGARVWIARIMITWGLISMATAFVVGPGRGLRTGRTFGSRIAIAWTVVHVSGSFG